MKTKLFFLVAFTLFTSPIFAQDKPKTKPVRMGSGAMTFDTVPGWGMRPDGSSPVGSTHGSVVVDKDNNVYFSANAGVFVFTPDGVLVTSYVDKDHSAIHDMEIRQEEGGEFIYGARNNNAEGIKFNAKTGEIVLRLECLKKLV